MTPPTRKMKPTGERTRDIPEMSFDQFVRDYIVEGVHGPIAPLGPIHLMRDDGEWLATIRWTFIDEVQGTITGKVTTPTGRIAVDYLAVAEGRRKAFSS